MSAPRGATSIDLAQGEGMLQVASTSLAQLLADARELLARHARQHSTQRGATRSLNLVSLTWKAPQQTEGEGLTWSARDVEWYLRTFVAKRQQTDPSREVQAGELLFPYTYAARTRFWDGGWAYLDALLREVQRHDIDLRSAARSKAYFADMVVILSERLHVQLVLSVLALHGPALLSQYLDNPALARTTAASWRRDTLEGAVRDIAANPHSRRAIVTSFSYPHLEEALRPQMGKPPYALFQFLPDDAEAPISSVHEHRSLDLVSGAQLDFAHDHSWLTYASRRLGRPIGDITIIAHNLHEYAQDGADRDEARTAVRTRRDGIEQWLCFVTDGYRSHRADVLALIQQPAYAANLGRIFSTWRRATL